jgi:hypothetical protein
MGTRDRNHIKKCYVDMYILRWIAVCAGYFLNLEFFEEAMNEYRFRFE